MMRQAPSSGKVTSSIFPFGAAAFGIATFIADTLTHLEIAVAVLYVVVVLMAARFVQRRGVLLVSAGCVGLTLLSFFLSRPMGPGPTGVINTLVSILAIGLTTFLVRRSQTAEMVLREQANLLNLTHDTVFVRDMKDVITYWNRGAEELYGWQRDQALGKVSHELTQTIFPAPLEEINETLLRTGRWEGELIHTKRDGARVVVSSRWSLQRDDRGHPLAILETNNNITERKEVEQTLREQASLLDLTHDAIFVRDLESVITYWSRGATELYGWRNDEAIEQVTHDVLHTVFPASVELIESELLATGRWEGELIHTKKDGTQLVVASRWSLQRDDRGKPIAILETNNDITERRRAEEALRESEEQWRDVFENNPTMYFMVDAAGKVLAVNPFGAQQLGYAVNDLIGQPVLSVFEESDWETVQTNLALCLQQLGRAKSWEARKVRRDGKVLWVRETAKAVQRVEGPIVLIACEDMTEKKRAEEALRKAQEELAHVTRVMTMGELVASIAHEVNQPLGAIVTSGHACVRLLSREVPDIDKSLETIGRMIKDGMRASEVIKRIRAVLHKTPTENAPLNINETIQEVIALVSSDVLRSKVEMRAELAPDLPPVAGDRIQLQQVILNLILNGKDAMSGVKSNPRELLITSRKSKAGELVVAVRDSGHGLDPADAERIFDPFFTTKAEGMGLGLSISRNIIEAHGGALWAAPNEDRGATIQFTLPPSGT